MTSNELTLEHDRLAAAVREAAAAKAQARTSPGVMGYFAALDAEQWAVAKLAAFKEAALADAGISETKRRENELRADVVQAALAERRASLALKEGHLHQVPPGAEQAWADALTAHEAACDALLAFIGEGTDAK